VPAYRELSGSCIADWTYIDGLVAKEGAGAAHLRGVLGDSFESRARADSLNVLFAGLSIRSVLKPGPTMPGVPPGAPPPPAPNPTSTTTAVGAAEGGCGGDRSR